MRTFANKCYILPSQLSTVAQKMMSIRLDETAQAYLNHRMLWSLTANKHPTACVRCRMPRVSMSGEKKSDFHQSR